MKNSKKIFIFILIIVILFLLIVYLIAFFLSHKKLPNRSHETVAPYYKKEVFKKPPEITFYEKKVEKIKLPIIMYHYVEYVKDLNDFIRKRLNINPKIFENQLKTLKDNNFQTYFVKDIPDILKGKIKIASSSVILTFDDGYEDFYLDVFPLLKKYQMKATIYVICNFIGRRGFLNQKELKEIIASGLVEIGSHTLSHPNLKLLSENQAKEQILGCKKKLENELGIEIKSFAYPYGFFNKKTIDLVKEAGYVDAVSVINGNIQSENNLYYLSRIRAGAFEGKNMIKLLKK
jgi:peptidoglycan/xylan/chitin deacetylase (PgdA/CDA1 family)